MWRLSDSGVEKEKVGQSGSSLSTLKMPRAQQIFVSVAFNNLEFASADTNRGTVRRPLRVTTRTGSMMDVENLMPVVLYFSTSDGQWKWKEGAHARAE